MAEFKKNPDKIGALWLTESKKTGKKYMSGVVNDLKINVIKNEYKKEDKQPDYIIMKSNAKKVEEEKKPESDVPF